MEKVGESYAEPPRRGMVNFLIYCLFLNVYHCLDFDQVKLQNKYVKQRNTLLREKGVRKLCVPKGIWAS